MKTRLQKNESSEKLLRGGGGGVGLKTLEPVSREWEKCLHAGNREKGKFYRENFWNVPFIFVLSSKKPHKSIFSYNASSYLNWNKTVHISIYACVADYTP